MSEDIRRQLQGCRDLPSTLARGLSCALKISGAPRGNIQLMNWDRGYLTIQAQYGFDDEFLSFFAKAGTKPRACPKCGGSGQLVESQHKQGVSLQRITTCLECGGRGVIIDAPCARCAGSGKVAGGEALTVRIPIGVEEGTALRVPGHGLPADKPGLPPGDLFVIVRSVEDSRFERHGRDLYCIETIDVVDAILGANIDVPTLDGRVSVKVPAGAQPDSMLRLQGKGLPRFGGGSRGDLYVRLQVHVPEQLSNRQRQLFEQLRALGERAHDKK